MTLEEELAAENRRYEDEARIAERGYGEKLAPLVAALEAAKRECAADTLERIARGKANKRAIIERHANENAS